MPQVPAGRKPWTVFVHPLGDAKYKARLHGGLEHFRPIMRRYLVSATAEAQSDMSNPVPLAAVTAILQQLLSELPADVTVLPPDVARSGCDDAQLNLFLYQVRESSQLRDADAAGGPHPGGAPATAGAWELDYLLTAYGAGDDELSGQQLMGSALALLDERAVFGAAELRNFAEQDGAAGIERMRITRSGMTFDDMSVRWANLRTAYRLSVGYRVLLSLKTPAR